MAQSFWHKFKRSNEFWVKLFSPPNVIQQDAANLPLGVITSPVVERLERKRIFKARHDMKFFMKQ